MYGLYFSVAVLKGMGSRWARYQPVTALEEGDEVVSASGEVVVVREE